MASSDDGEKEKAKEKLIKNYRILEFGRIDKADPTDISLNIHHELDSSSNGGFFNYIIHGNTLLIDFWAENYEEGIKSISTWWALTEAESTPFDRFNKNKVKFHLRAWLPLLFGFIAHIFYIINYLHIMVPILGTIISTFYFWELRKETQEWSERLKTKIRENVFKINYNLSESDLDKIMNKDCYSLFQGMMSFRLGMATNGIMVGFLLYYLMLEIFPIPY